MVRVENLRLGSEGFTIALLQSKYSVVSWLAQNLRASSSFLNLGIDLRLFDLFILSPFVVTLVASRNYADLMISYGKNNR